MGGFCLSRAFHDPKSARKNLIRAAAAGCRLTALLRSRFAGRVTRVPGRFLFGLQRALTFRAFGFGAFGLNRSVTLRLLRAFGLPGFVFRLFDLAGGFDRTALGRLRSSRCQPFCESGSAVLARNFSSAAFLALAAAAWRSIKSGCLKPAIYFAPGPLSRPCFINAGASRPPSLRWGYWYLHCAKHRYSIGTKMEGHRCRRDPRKEVQTVGPPAERLGD